MSLFYYIAASHELPTGSFGHKKTVMSIQDYVTKVNPEAKNQYNMQILLEKYPKGDALITVFDTQEDAAGLFITGPMSEQTTIFRQPYVYQINPEGGSFKFNEEIKQAHLTSYQSSKKCVKELFKYLRSNMEKGEEIELYSCWASGYERFSETPIKELNRVIELDTFELGNEFNWEERQYIRVIR